MEAVREHLKNTFTSYELELLRYLYLCIAYDGSKFLILLIFFNLFHLGREFCMGILFLLSLRNFFGGLHFNHYTSCFAFTFAFSSAGIALSHLVLLDKQLQTGLLLIIVLVSANIKPVVSANRPPLSVRQEKIYHACGMTVLLIYFVLFLTLQTFPYRNICFWVIILQTLQLVAAKLSTKGETLS
ncbi:MAG: accessory gene regulator B family protein [Ruminococcus flavefaciens]|nr:accessory gene regulator B family protein [Ruminococcus flavefaciens]